MSVANRPSPDNAKLDQLRAKRNRVAEAVNQGKAKRKALIAPTEALVRELQRYADGGTQLQQEYVEECGSLAREYYAAYKFKNALEWSDLAVEAADRVPSDTSETRDVRRVLYCERGRILGAMGDFEEAKYAYRQAREIAVEQTRSDSGMYVFEWVEINAFLAKIVWYKQKEGGREVAILLEKESRRLLQEHSEQDRLRIVDCLQKVTSRLADMLTEVGKTDIEKRVEGFNFYLESLVHAYELAAADPEQYFGCFQEVADHITEAGPKFGVTGITGQAYELGVKYWLEAGRDNPDASKNVADLQTARINMWLEAAENKADSKESKLPYSREDKRLLAPDEEIERVNSLIGEVDEFAAQVSGRASDVSVSLQIYLCCFRARVLQINRDDATAVRRFAEAIVIGEARLRENPVSEVAEALATAYIGRAKIAVTQDDPGSAAIYAKQAVKRARSLRERKPESDDKLAEVLGESAAVLARIGRNEEARETMKEAIKIWGHLAKKQRRWPINRYLTEYAPEKNAAQVLKGEEFLRSLR